MDVKKIPIGNNPPYEVNVIIEIPMGGSPVKYEMDKESGAIFVDRFLHTAMYYPMNYGFIPHTLSQDGDPIDAAVLGNIPVIPGVVIRSRPIGVLLMEDEGGIDEKVLCVPVDKLHPFHSNIGSYRDLQGIMLEQIAHFFAHYKDLEKGKWVQVKRWGETEEAFDLIRAGIERAKEGK
jgi:inorganic pyrophosphatase